MFVFLDANILLSFYHFTSDDLDQLQKLCDEIEGNNITLALPEQVKQEFSRNREAKIADALSRLHAQKLSLEFPQMCKDSQLYDALRSAQRAYEQNHNLLLTELTQAANSRQLKADLVIDRLFSAGTTYPIQDTIITKAQLRMSLGNPPGKKGSLGDAVNWETLLDKVPNRQDLYFIANDVDFCSAIDDTRFSQFLSDEWTTKKHSSLYYFKKLSPFTDVYFPAIQLKTEHEIEIETLIHNLAASRSFARTHEVIQKLDECEFTDEQTDEIISAIVNNRQVYWIIDDPDVKKFSERVIASTGEEVELSNLLRLRELLRPPEPTEFPPVGDEFSPPEDEADRLF